MFSGREAGPLQWPFVGLTVLLMLLIVTTPSLLGIGTHAAGSPNTTAELVVYRSLHGNVTSFTVNGVETTGFRMLHLGVSPLASWPFAGVVQNISWTNWTNASDSISVTLASNASLVAVNATAVFEDASGGIAIYQGIYAFNVTGTTIYLAPLTPGLSPGTTTLLLANLPEPLPLLEVSTTP